MHSMRAVEVSIAYREFILHTTNNIKRLHRMVGTCKRHGMVPPRKVSVVGSGSWGSTITRIIAWNTVAHPNVFQPAVHMYVRDTTVFAERKLVDIINEDRENVKYLKGYKFPNNVIAESNIVKACSNSDIIIFVIPHQYLKQTCAPLAGKIKPTAIGVSLVKGLHICSNGNIHLFSRVLKNLLGINISVLMGANLAGEIAKEQFSESTLGCSSSEEGLILRKLFHAPYFKISVTDDLETVELCGALKNIIACAAGFSDGLGFGDNTKAAVMRLGLHEMIRFCREFQMGVRLSTFLESCGIADLITTCYGGRNYRVSKAFATSRKPLLELEAEMLNGQKLQGPQTAEEVYLMLEKNDKLKEYPIFHVVHKICSGQAPPAELIKCLEHYPVFSTNSK